MKKISERVTYKKQSLHTLYQYSSLTQPDHFFPFVLGQGKSFPLTQHKREKLVWPCQTVSTGHHLVSGKTSCHDSKVLYSEIRKHDSIGNFLNDETFLQSTFNHLLFMSTSNTTMKFHNSLIPIGQPVFWLDRTSRPELCHQTVFVLLAQAQLLLHQLVLQLCKCVISWSNVCFSLIAWHCVSSMSQPQARHPIHHGGQYFATWNQQQMDHHQGQMISNYLMSANCLLICGQLFTYNTFPHVL